MMKTSKCVPIKGYPNYLIYEDGQIFSIKANKFIKSYPNHGDYLRVQLCNKFGFKNFRVNRLVAKHFLSNYCSTKQVNHKDYNRQNNHYTNLEMSTCLQNIKHRDLRNK